MSAKYENINVQFLLEVAGARFLYPETIVFS